MADGKHLYPIAFSCGHSHQGASTGHTSGGYQSILTDDQKPIAGKVDKKSQRAGWRIGDNTETVYESTLGNLTLDVAPVSIHFGKDRTQTWLLARMPAPAPAGKERQIPPVSKTPPPLAKSTP